ncbi:methyltransferase [Pedobacter psychrophilus]|uniref:Methyltransferase n=1 Tax=Pedobacter psychrophilus TaxID=1826909 RepID=A0A179DL36_9SPHI|nr:SAM-dependent methyltransferase [Pedobacter psychrophilus]OAQ41765.1 methyltransferase [Pedobacter psychrophilus]
MSYKETLNADYFAKVYAANDDPWNFETSVYEAEKYASTIASLPKENYGEILEIGCSIGVLTKLLAKKCNHLLATDVSEKALEIAKKRCNDLENIQFKNISFPDQLPEEKYDLIVVSEVAYYLSSADWALAIDKMYNMLMEKGQIALIHWLPEVHDYPQTGDEVHYLFADEISEKMVNVFNSRAEKYRIDIWEKVNRNN